MMKTWVVVAMMVVLEYMGHVKSKKNGIKKYDQKNTYKTQCKIYGNEAKKTVRKTQFVNTF